MLTREELQTAQDFLAAAEREFALGDLVAGFRAYWGLRCCRGQGGGEAAGVRCESD